MLSLGVSVPELVVRAAITYTLFVGALRVFGKRQIGQFTIFDLTLVLLASNALQPAMTGPDVSLLGGLVLVATLFTIDRVLSFLRVRSTAVRQILGFQPSVVGRNGHWLLPEMVRQGLDLVDVEGALREHGIDDVGKMKLATLEADGSISIVGTDVDGGQTSTRRRRRYRRTP